MRTFRRRGQGSDRDGQAPAKTPEYAPGDVSREHLRIVNRVLAATRGPYEVPALLDLLVSEIVDATGVRWGTIKLRDEKSDVAETVIRRPGAHAGTVPRLFENTAFYLVMGSGESLVVEDLASDPRFPEHDRKGDLPRRLLACPVQYQGELIGVLTLVDRLDGSPFDEDTCSLAMLLAAEAGGIITNARLFEEALDHRAMEHERRMAEEVWRRFLPNTLPNVEGFDLAACCDPAREIGGDYYDAVPLADGRTVLALGDVSGSGLAAALLMSNVHAGLRIALLTPDDLSHVVCSLNRHLCTTTAPVHFATLFLGAVDPAVRRLEYVNAGHNAPLRVHADGTLDTLPATGIPVGFIPDAAYGVESIELAAGDLLLFFSDGIIEAEDANGEMFGDKRLLELIRSIPEVSAAETVEALRRRVQHWTRDSDRYQDDRTLVVLRCL